MRMKLTREQAGTLPFPVGCPVWYDLPDGWGADAAAGGTPKTARRGAVASVSFDCDAKDLIYVVVRRTPEGKVDSAEEVVESRLAYAAGCPVTVVAAEAAAGGSSSSSSSVEGTVLLCRAAPSGPKEGPGGGGGGGGGAAVYTIAFRSGGGRARFEHGIERRRVRYRAEEKTMPLAAAAAASDPVEPAASVASPSSITCDSLESGGGRCGRKRNAEDGGVVGRRSRREEEADVEAKAMSSADSEGRESSSGTLSIDGRDGIGSSCGGRRREGAKQATDDLEEGEIAAANDDRRGAGGSGSGGRRSREARAREDLEEGEIATDGDANDVRPGGTRTAMKIPGWLQRDWQSQRDLFFHLIGSDARERTSKRTVLQVARETATRIDVKYRSPREGVLSDPIVIAIDARSRSSAPRDLAEAREKVTELLMEYLDRVGDRESKAHLAYDLASNCSADGRAVRARDDGAGECFLSVMGLPRFRVEGRARHHGSQILRGRVLGRIRDAGCRVRVCGDDFGVPLKLSEPHVVVTGRVREDVDRAVEIVKEANAQHMRWCSCGFA